jgi:ABC-2 type transport system permease protein
MGLAWAFFKRDASIAFSYRVAFSVQLFGNILLLAVFFFIGKTIGEQDIPALEPYGGNFLAFMLIGIALTDCVGVSLTTFANQIREGQLTGTLEATLMSPVSLPVILIYSSLWAYFFSAIRFVLYLVVGGLFYGVGLAQANVVSAVLIFILTIMCFMGVGILWASVITLVKRGEAILSIVGLVVILLSGVLFPNAVLPGWLQRVADLVPLTHALEGMRFAILKGHGLDELASVVWTLVAFAVLLLSGGIGTFNAAVNLVKRTASLTQY